MLLDRWISPQMPAGACSNWQFTSSHLIVTVSYLTFLTHHTFQPSEEDALLIPKKVTVSSSYQTLQSLLASHCEIHYDQLLVRWQKVCQGGDEELSANYGIVKRTLSTDSSQLPVFTSSPFHSSDLPTASFTTLIILAIILGHQIPLLFALLHSC